MLVSMLKLKRHKNNPIFSADTKNSWEAQAVFNGSVIETEGGYAMLYRALSAPREIGGVTMSLSTIGVAESKDALDFKKRRQLIVPEYEWERFGCEDPRVTRVDGKYYIFYTALSTYPFSADGIKVALAISKDLKTIESKHLVTPFNAKAMALLPEKLDGKLAAVLTVNTDRPPAHIALAIFDNEKQIWSRDYWDDWYKNLKENAIPLLRTPADHLEVGAQPIKTKKGWLLVYSYISDYLGPKRTFGIEAALLNIKNPRYIIAKTHTPILEPQENYELNGMVPNVVFPSGALVKDGNLQVYYGAADTSVGMASVNLEALVEEIYKDRHELLVRFEQNPIIQPEPKHVWESKATFNAAAIDEGGEVHILYRAMSRDNTSVFGYASSRDGLRIDERLPMPVYVPRADFERKKLANANSGCEDPRITKIDDKFYVLYTAFTGTDVPRIALTSIAVDSFLKQEWHWADPVLISPPGLDDKDGCIFPKKFGNKYLILHRISKGIDMAYVDNLNFDGTTFIAEDVMLFQPREDSWDSKKIGISGIPIETEKGWLLIYHGVDKKASIYRLGAVLLDKDDPSKVIGRLKNPIFEPRTHYEREGIVSNVVFSCGTVVRGEILYVYYGGGDRVLGVATANINDILMGF